MTPILYSFRRCPYAMRARLALLKSGQDVCLREIKLREKPEAFLQVSVSATVPCLVLNDAVIDESIDIMRWALAQSDPDGWLDMPLEGWEWISLFDGPFKTALDRTKYPTRYPGDDPKRHRARAVEILAYLDDQMGEWVFEKPSVVDFALLPFVRQFAGIDQDWFDEQPWPRVQAWLARFVSSEAFAAIMHKYEVWQPGDDAVVFPHAA
ncbi:MAG: glutathione S-transferase [Aliishimia sp.]